MFSEQGHVNKSDLSKFNISKYYTDKLSIRKLHTKWKSVVGYNK